jgi:hypothetical protein
MTETTTRIRWEPTKYGGWTGHVGTLEGHAFQVWETPADTGVGPWRLESSLPGNFWRKLDGTDPGELKGVAEAWLAEFVTSLGAVFPDTIRQAIASERERRGSAAGAAKSYELQNRYWGWTDALDWMLTLLASPEDLMLPAPGPAAGEE